MNWVLAAIVVLVASSAAATAADRLPFPDGSYASNVKFCKMSEAEVYEKYEFGFYSIRGNKISNYELFCDVRDVSVKGSSVRFKQICESEGDRDVSRVVWKKLGPNKFSDSNGKVWTGCGHFIE